MPLNIMSVSYHEAAEIIDAILQKAESDGGSPVAVAVTSSMGKLIAFAAMDYVVPACIRLSQSKAYSSVAGQKDTIHWASFPKNIDVIDFDMRNWTDPDFSGFTGGVVLTMNDTVIGGIGVSGRKGKMSDTDLIPQDHELALYGKTIFNKSYIRLQNDL